MNVQIAALSSAEAFNCLTAADKKIAMLAAQILSPKCRASAEESELIHILGHKVVVG